MNRDVIEKMLEKTTWPKTAEQVRERFVIKMRGCQYDADSLMCAWCWYIAGVNAAVDIISHADVIYVEIPSHETEG